MRCDLTCYGVEMLQLDMSQGCFSKLCPEYYGLWMGSHCTYVLKIAFLT